MQFGQRFLKFWTTLVQCLQKKTQQNLPLQQKESKNNMNYLIKKYEGCRLKAYKDAVGIPTIGFGTTVYPDGTPVKMGDVITQDQADAYMNHYIMNHITPHIKDLGLTDNQRIAVESCIYNIGWSAFNKSKCYKAIKAKDWGTAYREWDWITAGGKVLNGLIKRREEERYLFFLDI